MCALTAYMPTWMALMAAPEMAMPAISDASRCDGAMVPANDVRHIHASASAAAIAATASEARDPKRAMDHATMSVPAIPARLKSMAARTAVRRSKPSEVNTSGAQLKKA